VARILADVGGTCARFAWQEQSGAALCNLETVECRDYVGPAEAVGDWLRRHRLGPPEEAAIALAAPITRDDALRMTNGLWCFSRRGLAEHLGLRRLAFLNDFTALAIALPALRADELRQIGGRQISPFSEREPVGVLGPGTGLGVSGLIPGPQGSWIPLAGEGGHNSLAAHDSETEGIVRILRGRFGHVSAERVLSGEGLCNLWSALRTLETRADSVPGSRSERCETAPTAEEITELALRDRLPLACKVIEVFCGMLGHVAGNLALTLGARGGIFLGGGILPRWGTRLEDSPLRACFEAKGRFRSYLEAIPIWVINASDPPALRGAARFLDSHADVQMK